MPEGTPELAPLRERYPGWRFWPRDENGPGYAARRLHAPACEEQLWAHTLEELAALVTEREHALRAAQAYVDAVERGMRAYFASRERLKRRRARARATRMAEAAQGSAAQGSAAQGSAAQGSRSPGNAALPPGSTAPAWVLPQR